MIIIVRYDNLLIEKVGKEMKKIIIVGLLLIFATGCGCSKETKESDATKLENTMKEYVTSFYDKNIKNYVKGITEQKVTITQLKALDFDTSKLTEPGKDTLCSEDSYAVVKIEDPSDVANSAYTIENHLTCGDYTTAK